MSVQPLSDPIADDKLYCTVQDVATWFDKYDDFTVNTNPSKKEVQRRIAAESDWVDNYTGHAWRERTIEREFHDLSGLYRWRSGVPVSLGMRDIRTPLDSAKGDKLEVWTGNDYDDLVSNSEYSEGRDEDYWIEQSTGILYIYRRYVFGERHREIRVTYRYGKETVPSDIRDVVSRRVAAYFLESQQYRITVPGNDDAPDASQVAEKWREQTEQEMDTYKEIRSTGL